MNWGRFVLLGGLAAFSGTTAHAQMPPETHSVVVQTVSGKVEGDARADVNVFLGIPFAAPPVGDLRWAPPQPVKPWPGIRTATAVEPACTQPVDPDYKTTNGGGVLGATTGWLS